MEEDETRSHAFGHRDKEGHVNAFLPFCFGKFDTFAGIFEEGSTPTCESPMFTCVCPLAASF